MKNTPRIFVGDNIDRGMIIPVSREVSHYLTRVMRRGDCIAFGAGNEFYAHITDDGRALVIGESTGRADPSNNITLYFSPIKRTDDLINMATQMGVAHIVPVITARTVAHHINWDRMRKIAIEAAEQSNRCSVPEISEPIRFTDTAWGGVAFADERAAHGIVRPESAQCNAVLVGPEGGFSDEELATLDAAGAIGISLGKTILRAELAAAIAISRITQ